MFGRLFHVFRNTPLGREIYLQSLYFCQQTGLAIEVYVPQDNRFLLYLERDVVQIDLDNSYLSGPNTAVERAVALAKEFDVSCQIFRATDYTAPSLPEIPVNFTFMCCPRTISDLSSKIGLGYLGPKVRVIVRSARFPVLVPSTVFKPWRSIAVFFGGSVNAFNALHHALALHQEVGMPIDLFTMVEEGRDQAALEKRIEAEGLTEPLSEALRDWYVWDGGELTDHLFAVPHDALVLVGAYGHGLIKELVFGSLMEEIQSHLCNSLLVVGPECHRPL